MRQKTKTVLVSAVGGDIGQGVIKSLLLPKRKIKIIGIDANTHAAGLFMSDKHFILPSASQSPKYYTKKLKELCKKERVDIAFICSEPEQAVIATAGENLRKTIKTHFVVQPKEVLKRSNDKWETYTLLTQTNIKTPETAINKKGAHALIRKYGFPVIVKERCGYGSKHLVVAKTKREFEDAWDAVPKPIAQEHITNRKNSEYTVGLFLNHSSKVLGAIAMKRRLRGGVTWIASVDAYPSVTKTAAKTAEAIGAVGPCNVQLRTNSRGIPYVIEVNARISGTSVFRAKSGFNEPEACIRFFLENKIPKFSPKKCTAMRTWGEVIIPFREI